MEQPNTETENLVATAVDFLTKAKSASFVYEGAGSKYFSLEGQWGVKQLLFQLLNSAIINSHNSTKQVNCCSVPINPYLQNRQQARQTPLLNKKILHNHFTFFFFMLMQP